MSVSFIVGVLHLALGLLLAVRLVPVEGSGGGARGSGAGGGGGGGYKGEWQHPSSRPRTSANPWTGAGGSSAESVGSGGVGRPGRREEGGGRRDGGRGAGALEAEEARGWSERKRSESMRDIIEASFFFFFFVF